MAGHRLAFDFAHGLGVVGRGIAAGQDDFLFGHVFAGAATETRLAGYEFRHAGALFFGGKTFPFGIFP